MPDIIATGVVGDTQVPVLRLKEKRLVPAGAMGPIASRELGIQPPALPFQASIVHQ